MKVLRLGAIAAIAMAFVISLVGGQVKAAGTGGVGTNIVGGTDATQQYGAISLWYPDRHRCTASLIDKYWALTAAHCAPILIPGSTEVRASSLDNTGANVEQVGLAAVYPHPGFDPNSDDFVNDVALIKFQRPVTKTQPLKLAAFSPPVGTGGIMAGWGWTCEDAEGTDPDCNHTVNILQELKIKVVKDATCEWSFDPKNQLCGVAASGAQANGCYGDSGAPFVRKGFGNDLILMGVTIGDGDTDIYPGACSTHDVNGGQGTAVLIDVAKYHDWICDTMFGSHQPSKKASIFTKL
jgi:secreted trypsin-like serine protease